MTAPVDSVELPAHEHVVEPWRQTVRGGTRDDRMVREVTASVPPAIAGLDVAVPAVVGARMDDALREIAGLDETHGEHLASLATLLLRAESVASSKIEYVEASVDDYARALHGVRSNASASSMVASTDALKDLIDSVDHGGTVDLDNILTAHATLMSDDPHELPYAGRSRDVQNWIGGSDHSPRGAMYVPPPPRMVGALLNDLRDFANRTDVGVLVQAAVVHAQFESIHPFTDGNGRIGRALINTILRRRGATRRVVVPLASAIVAGRDGYFDALGAYRDGDAGPIVGLFARGSMVAAQESRITAERLALMPDRWREMSGSPRRGSAAASLLDGLLDHPIFSADEAAMRLKASSTSAYDAIARLHQAGVIRPLTNRTRGQIWIADSLAVELDDLGVRIATRARGES